jgi:hypothetical protein
MKFTKEDLFNYTTHGFNCAFIPEETFENEFNVFDAWYKGCYTEYSKLLTKKSSLVASYIIDNEEDEFIASKLKEDIRQYDNYNSILKEVREILDNQNSDSNLNKTVFEEKDKYLNLLKKKDSKIGHWEILPFFVFLKEKLDKKLEENDNLHLVFKIVKFNYDYIFNKKDNIADLNEFLVNKQDRFKNNFLSYINKRTFEILIEEEISDSDYVNFNFMRSWNNRNSISLLETKEIGVYNKLGEKISENKDGNSGLSLFILKGNLVVLWHINSDESYSTSHLKRQIKQIDTNSNLIQIYFHGNHRPIKVYLDSSKDAILIKNKLLSS